MTIVDLFYVRNFDWPARITHNWKLVVQFRCIISFLAFSLGLYALQCSNVIFGAPITETTRILFILTIFLWAIDPIICFFALPQTWLNYVILLTRIYTGFGPQIKQFLHWRITDYVNLTVNFVLEIVLILWQIGDFVFMWCKPLV